MLNYLPLRLSTYDAQMMQAARIGLGMAEKATQVDIVGQVPLGYQIVGYQATARAELDETVASLIQEAFKQAAKPDGPPLLCQSQRGPAERPEEPEGLQAGSVERAYGSRDGSIHAYHCQPDQEGWASGLVGFEGAARVCTGGLQPVQPVGWSASR